MLHTITHTCCLHCLDKLPSVAALTTVPIEFMTRARFIGICIRKARMSQSHRIP